MLTLIQRREETMPRKLSVFLVVCILAMSLDVCLKAYSQRRVTSNFVPASFDLVSDAFDGNGLLMNPKWGYQRNNPGQPDLEAQKRCNNEPDTPPCTTQRTYRDYGYFGCGPHVNCFPVTYDGPIFWHDHSVPGSDDDYNFLLRRQDRAGQTSVDGDGLLLEFSSDETIDHFHTPWWNQFHEAVDDGDGVGYDALLMYGRGLISRDEAIRRWQNRYSRARGMVDGKYAVVTGLGGLDCEHSCGAELHPVYAMAIQVNDDRSLETWAIFVRHWGDEGWCGTSQHLWVTTSSTFRLPWWQLATPATRVDVLDARFLTNTPTEATG